MATLTLSDLKIEDDDIRTASYCPWKRVTTPDGRKFLVGSCDLTAEDVDPTELILLYLGIVPEKETWVMEATEDWEVLNECSEECATGVCKKRLASNLRVADLDLGYRMLLDALNA